MSKLPNIVCVHGAWADGSSWSAVIERLQAKNYNVIAPQFALGPIDRDIEKLREVLNRQSGPTIVAAHSYGGQIVTALGNDAPNVVGLVYVAGFGLDRGESIGALLSGAPPTLALAHIDVDTQGLAWLPQEDFINHFAGDVDPVRAKVMYAVQQPFPMTAFRDVMGYPAWKSISSWYVVAQNDEVIPPEAERRFAKRMGARKTELPSSHVAMISHPDEVCDVIDSAARAIPVAT